MHELFRVEPETVALLRAAGCVYAEDEARLLTEAADSPAQLARFLERRANGEPLEYIVGWAEFRGLRVPIRSGVFVPRRRSEFLAECAVAAVGDAAAREPGERPIRVLDMCCGSGAIGLAVAAETGSAVELYAVDNAPAAVECARGNLARVGGRVYRGDLFDALPRAGLRTFEVIVANAPYVPTGEIACQPAEARLHEPMSTLDGGNDGTSVQKRILTAAPDWLRPGGVVLVETASGMDELTVRHAREAGLTPQTLECADLEATVVSATLPRRSPQALALDRISRMHARIDTAPTRK